MVYWPSIALVASLLAPTSGAPTSSSASDSPKYLLAMGHDLDPDSPPLSPIPGPSRYPTERVYNPFVNPISAPNTADRDFNQRFLAPTPVPSPDYPFTNTPGVNRYDMPVLSPPISDVDSAPRPIIFYYTYTPGSLVNAYQPPDAGLSSSVQLPPEAVTPTILSSSTYAPVASPPLSHAPLPSSSSQAPVPSNSIHRGDEDVKNSLPAFGVPADAGPSSHILPSATMGDKSINPTLNGPILSNPDLTVIPHMLDPTNKGPALPPPVTTTAVELITSTETATATKTSTATEIETRIQIATSTYTESPVTVTATATATASAPPSTTTEYITVSPSSTSSSASTNWSAPERFDDLSSFKVYNPPSSHKNLIIVNGIPAAASASTASNHPQSTGKTFGRNWVNSSSALQCFYPSGSINPGNKDAPQGGFQFYAIPLPDIGSATTATLEYGVFFPTDFAWVKGGKLPGFYGGHTGCSGGNAALDCFSTRLMWRNDGAGELYLYAPKDKQTADLCNDPQSVCDAAYGLSVGRGSFNWKPGAWTHTKQTVVLNTPGEQDGTFILEVDGKVVISRRDVFYRDTMSGGDGSGSAKKKTTSKPKSSNGLLDPLLTLSLGILDYPSTSSQITNTPSPTTTTRLPPDPFFGPPASIIPLKPSSSPTPPPYGLLEPLLGGIGQLEGSIGLLEITTTNSSTPTLSSNRLFGTDTSAPLVTSTMSGFGSVPTDDSSSEEPTDDSDPSEGDGYSTSDDSSSSTPPGFTGLFFSTFFGGHDTGWASPKDQYTWFKDFAISYQNRDGDR